MGIARRHAPAAIVELTCIKRETSVDLAMPDCAVSAGDDHVRPVDYAGPRTTYLHRHAGVFEVMPSIG
jgi:hypothetical protein